MFFNTRGLKFAYIHILFTSCFATAEVKVESVHYGLAVGQGQCSTTISTISLGTSNLKFAVTADIGSSSLRTDPKFSSGYDYENMTLILKPKMSDLLTKSKVGAKRDHSASPEDIGAAITSTKRPRVSIKKPILSKPRFTSVLPRTASRGASLSGSDNETLKESFQFLIDQFKDVICWFVFLSHPDKDHINYLPSTFESIIERAASQTGGRSSIKMCLVAGGEWFNPESTEQIREVISFWKSQRDNIVALFPFQDACLDTREFEDWMAEDRDITKAPRSFNPKKLVNGQDLESFHGTLKTCLDLIYPDKHDILKSKLGLAEDAWALLEEHVLSKIYIWSLDYRTGDANAQSLVWSHAVDDLGWTFVYTGDAEEKTFEKIHSVLEWSKTPEYITSNPTQSTGIALTATDVATNTNRGIKEAWMKAGDPISIELWDPSQKGVVNVIQGSTNLLMLYCMHHGSKENFSDIALRLFPPDACFFSAGNGGLYAHPHYHAVSQYSEKTITENIWRSYELMTRIPYGSITFDEKGGGSKIGKAWMVPLEENGPVLLCPNTYGTVVIDKRGISVPYFTHHSGYVMYTLLRAYETNDLSIIGQSFRVNCLTKKNNQKGDAYHLSEFLYYLEDKTVQPNMQDQTVYEDTPDAPYKLRMIRNKLGEEDYIYFYVLEKIT